MSRPVQVALVVLAAVVLTGGGFAAGMRVAGGQLKVLAGASPSPSAASGRRVFVGGAGGAGAADRQRRTVAGKVISVGDGSITVEVDRPGSGQARSVIALVGGNAKIVRSTETPLSAADIKVGDQVLVAGQADATTGAVSASAVVVGANVLRDLFGGARGGAPARAGSPSPSSQP